jgi:hypothetical protein
LKTRLLKLYKLKIRRGRLDNRASGKENRGRGAKVEQLNTKKHKGMFIHDGSVKNRF